ncbi:MAG: cobalt transporter CbiM [Acuticoccus sp.]
MAHFPDGIVSAPLLVVDGVIAAAGVAWALRRIDDRAIPRVAVLSAVFFAGSLVAIPVGPSNVHLLLSGLMGIMLGVGVVPAVCVALLLQTMLFGIGGLTTLGVNTVNIALPGLVVGLLAGPAVRRAASVARASLLAGLGGAAAALATGALVAFSLWVSSSDYVPVASVLMATFVPLAIGEGAIAAVVVGFLRRVQPDALRPRLSAGAA